MDSKKEIPAYLKQCNKMRQQCNKTRLPEGYSVNVKRKEGQFIGSFAGLMGVRFIAVNNAFDSMKLNNGTPGIEVAVSNLVNNLYSRDIGKKVRAALEVNWKSGKATSVNPTKIVSYSSMLSRLAAMAGRESGLLISIVLRDFLSIQFRSAFV